MIWVIIGIGIGLIFTWMVWTEMQGGEFFAIGGILGAIYLSYNYDFSFAGIYPFIAIASGFLAYNICKPKEGSTYLKEQKKRQAEAHLKGDALSLSEHIYMTSKGLR